MQTHPSQWVGLKAVKKKKATKGRVEQKGSGLFFSTYHHLFLVQTHCRKRDLTPFVLSLKVQMEELQWGKHQRINIRRSIKKVGLKAVNKSGGG